MKLKVNASKLKTVKDLRDFIECCNFQFEYDSKFGMFKMHKELIDRGILEEVKPTDA